MQLFFIFLVPIINLISFIPSIFINLVHHCILIFCILRTHWWVCCTFVRLQLIAFLCFRLSHLFWCLQLHISLQKAHQRRNRKKQMNNFSIFLYLFHMCSTNCRLFDHTCRGCGGRMWWYSSQCLSPPRSINGYQRQNAGDNLRWTGIPSRGSSNMSSRFHATETGISRKLQQCGLVWSKQRYHDHTDRMCVKAVCQSKSEDGNSLVNFVNCEMKINQWSFPVVQSKIQNFPFHNPI